MTIVYVIIAVVVGAALGALLGKRGTASGTATATDETVAKLRSAAEAEAAEIKKAAELAGQELAAKRKSELDDELRARKAEVAKREEALGSRERDLDRQKKEAERRASELDKRERSAEGKTKQVDAALEKAEAAQAAAKARLEEVAGLSADAARARLEDSVRAQAQAAAAAEIKRITDEAERESQAKAKTIIATAIQRYASEFVHERTVAVVPLPSDDMKGRLIGREGRNIRALEAATGIDVIIDDTTEAITISCFNPVRREIARLAIGALVADGRIHPTRIEEVVRKAEKDVDKVCREAGEQAVFDLGLHRVHPELVRLLGQLKMRSSLRPEPPGPLGRGRLPGRHHGGGARAQRQAGAPRRPAPRHRQGRRARAGGRSRRARRAARAQARRVAARCARRSPRTTAPSPRRRSSITSSPPPTSCRRPAPARAARRWRPTSSGSTTSRRSAGASTAWARPSR
jgi:ribonuclease Y